MVVAGEFCAGGSIWCNIATKKTLLSNDGGESFAELADFPGADVEATCGVFLDDATFMVIGGSWSEIVGGSFVTEYYNDTWLYDVAADTWSEGPQMAIPRQQHSCKLITDCDGNKQVVVVGGEVSPGQKTNSTEIYDVNSGTWSEGEKRILCAQLPRHLSILMTYNAPTVQGESTMQPIFLNAYASVINVFQGMTIQLKFLTMGQPTITTPSSLLGAHRGTTSQTFICKINFLIPFCLDIFATPPFPA